MDKLYYNHLNLCFSGRTYVELETYPDGSKLIKFPTFGGESIVAYPDDLNETYKQACEKKWQEERNRIAKCHWHS